MDSVELDPLMQKQSRILRPTVWRLLLAVWCEHRRWPAAPTWPSSASSRLASDEDAADEDADEDAEEQVESVDLERRV